MIVYTTMFTPPTGRRSEVISLENPAQALDGLFNEPSPYKIAAFMQHMTPEQWAQLRVTYLERLEQHLTKEAEKHLASYDTARDRIRRAKEIER